jgi:hypothetical protein
MVSIDRDAIAQRTVGARMIVDVEASPTASVALACNWIGPGQDTVSVAVMATTTPKRPFLKGAPVPVILRFGNSPPLAYEGREEYPGIVANWSVNLFGYVAAHILQDQILAVQVGADQALIAIGEGGPALTLFEDACHELGR